MGKLRIFVCGETRALDENDNVVEKFGGVKPRQVLEILALSVGRPVSKDRIAQLLWDNEPPPSYVGTLESYVCLLRRALGAKGRNSALQTTTTGYLLRADMVWVDFVEARRMLSLAGMSPSADERTSLVEQALTLLSGELLGSEPGAAWAAVQRAVHTRELTSSCTQAAESMLVAGETTLARRLSRLATGHEPLNELAWQLEMRALVQEGRDAEALSTYSRLRALLLDELGTEPSAASRSLYSDILQGPDSAPSSVSSHSEVSSLIRLLRQALESLPGVHVPDQDSRLSEVAVRVVAAASV